MATVYRKTHKGQAEIETRAHRLVPRLRTALILVDGKRTGDELASLIANDPLPTLQALLDQGFIEGFEVAPARGTSAARTAAAPSAESAPAAAAASDPKAFEKRRRDSVRYLNDHIGPMAEAIGVRIEKTTTWEQMLPALQLARQILGNERGAGTAEEFTRLFMEDAP
jgi:hypothetical protein